jgi:hypothetical protein
VHRDAGERLDAEPARSRHVDGTTKGAQVGEPPARRRDGLREPDRRIGGGQRRLDHEDLLEVDALAQAQTILDGGFLEGLVGPPHPRERVALDQDHEGMQPGLLEGGGEEQGEIEAGRLSMPGDLVGEANLLTLLLEAGRGVRVADGQLGQGAVQRGGDRGDALRAARLVTVEGPAHGRRAQVHCRALQQVGDDRVVGEDERGEQLRERAQAGPLPQRKQLDLPIDPGQDLGAAHDARRQHRVDPLRVPAQEVGVERELDDLEVVGGAGAQGVDALPPRSDAAGAERHLDVDAEDVVGTGVGDPDPLHHRHLMLLEGVVDAVVRLEVEDDGDRVRWGGIGHGRATTSGKKLGDRGAADTVNRGRALKFGASGLTALRAPPTVRPSHDPLSARPLVASPRPGGPGTRGGCGRGGGRAAGRRASRRARPP